MNDLTRQKISDIIYYLESVKYLTINEKQIGNYDKLLDEYETIKESEV